MRHPERWRNIALAAFLLGPPVAWAAWALPAAMAGDGLRVTLFSLGMSGLLFGGVGALMSQRAVRAERRLQEGEALLARWRIDAETWRRFLVLDGERNADGERWLPNEFTPREESGAREIEILVGADAVRIDDSLHLLPRHGAPEITRFEFDEARVRPSVIEFDLLYPGDATTSPRRTRLCFPVPRGSEKEAERIVAHFGQLTPGPATFFHGPGDGSNPEDLSTCWSCGYQTHRYVSTCERCGAGMLSKRWSRRFGVVLMLLGLPLALGMAWVLAWMWPTLTHPGIQIGSTRFDGSAAQASGIIALLSAVLVFGAIAFLYGLWQVVTGRRNIKVVYVLVGIAGALYLVGMLL